MGLSSAVENVEHLTGKVMFVISKSCSIRMCEVVSNLTDKEGNPLLTIEKVQEVLERKSHIVESYAYVIHDKDTYSTNDEKQNPEHKAGTLKVPHVHILLRFSMPQKINSVASWFGLAPQFVAKLVGGWKPAVNYLTHANAPAKYQYDVDDVVANFDVQAAMVDKYQALEDVLKKIWSGEIREYNKTTQISYLMLIENAREIETAFKFRADYLQATQQERKTEVVYITGPAGCGKSTLARKIANEQGLAYFVSSGSNDIMDGYMQQPCFIVDDVRPSSMGLSDFLKLLDNHNASLVKSRYKNKYLNCELIIITTVLPIEEFYHNVFESENEPITQLKRRCQTLIVMNFDTIQISRWDSARMEYSEPELYKNTIIDEYKADPKTREQIVEEIHGLIPFLEPVEPEPKRIQGEFSDMSDQDLPF